MWAQGISALIGIWLMAAPAVLGFDGPAATNARIVGPIIGAFGVIAMAQCTRGVRRANLPLATWLLLAPLFMHHSAEALVNSLAAGVIVGSLSLVRGRITHEFGGGWAALWSRSRGTDPRGRRPPRATQARTEATG